LMTQASPRAAPLGSGSRHAHATISRAATIPSGAGPTRTTTPVWAVRAS
jgi:hypothetical protein